MKTFNLLLSLACVCLLSSCTVQYAGKSGGGLVASVGSNAEAVEWDAKRGTFSAQKIEHSQAVEKTADVAGKVARGATMWAKLGGWVSQALGKF